MTDAPPPSGPAPYRDDDGYYHIVDEHGAEQLYLSVTTILGDGVPKPGLVHWAAIEVSRCALANIPKLARLRGQTARDECHEWLRRAAERKRDEAAVFGGLFHDYAEAHILGQPMPPPSAEMRPFLDAFYRFLDEHQPEFLATEMTVANLADRWAGRFDGAVKLPRYGPEPITIDYKSGRSKHDDMAMQLAAYRRATHAWLKDGTPVEPPRTEGGVIVHVRPDKPEYEKHGGYRLYKCDTSDEVYASFLAARDMAYGWTRRKAKRAVTVLDLPPLEHAA